MKIEFNRGDSYERGFILKNKATGATITTAWDEIYFTVKKYNTDTEFLIQKRLTSGGIVDDGNGHYTLFIEPADTDGMPFGAYVCDIEVVEGDYYKKTFPGSFILNPEVTHVSNE